MNKLLHKRFGLVIVALTLAACQAAGKAEPTPTLPALVVTIETPAPTPSPTALPPTATPSPTSEPPTPQPDPPTAAPPPTSTPYPAISLSSDLFTSIRVPTALANGTLSGSWLAFIHSHDQASTSTTPQQPPTQQTLYITRSDTRQRVEVGQVPIATRDQVYWSPTGAYVAYFVPPSADIESGLYIFDFAQSVGYRLLNISSLNPRGIAGHVPSWSPDGRRLAVALPTQYATDIFIIAPDGSETRSITQHGAYDLWPVFSPDGQWLAFVSDRARCPTWTPQEANTCDHPDATPPSQGNLFILNLTTGETRQMTDVLLNGPPRWISASQLEFSTGGGNALANTSDLWRVDIEAGSAVQVNPTGVLSLNQYWSKDGGHVVYQQAGETTSVVIADHVGRITGTSSDYIFPRFGLAADWSPDGQYLALGGRGGQCPYGLIVVDASFQVITAPSRTLLACNPVYSRNGASLAFMGIRVSASTDGRLDIYLTNANGLGASSITADLLGQKQMLGWVGQ